MFIWMKVNLLHGITWTLIFTVLIDLARFTPPHWKCCILLEFAVEITTSAVTNGVGVNAEPVISPQLSASLVLSGGAVQRSFCRLFISKLEFSICVQGGGCCLYRETLDRIVDLVSSWKEHHQLQDLVLSFWAVVSAAPAQAALCKTLIPAFPGVWSAADLLVQGEEQWVQKWAFTHVVTCHVKNRACKWSCYVCLCRDASCKK